MNVVKITAVLGIATLIAGCENGGPGNNDKTRDYGFR